MRVIRVPKSEGGFIRITDWDDQEYIDPVEHFKEVIMTSSISVDEEIILMNEPSFKIHVMHNILKGRAEEVWEENYKRLKSITIPENLIKLLECESKAEQIKALKGLSLTADEHMAFFIYAGEKYGYTLSNYDSHYVPTNFRNAKFPHVYYKKDDGTITKVGETNLSDAQLKQVLEQRKAMVIRLLDLGEKWHCFYHTYRSIGGNENHKDGQPHLHYISNYWTIPRETIVKELKSRTQNFTSEVHIEFHTHRNPM